MSTLNELSAIIHSRNVDKGFYETQKNIGEMLCLIHSEVSEALEADRKDHYFNGSFNLKNLDVNDLSDCNEIKYFQQEFDVSIKNTFQDELADIIIRVLDLAAHKNIDLDYHIKMKMAYNNLREYKHGKKY